MDKQDDDVGIINGSTMLEFPLITLGSDDEDVEDDELFGDADEEEVLLVLNLFFNVEFQKFLISLSVLPGRRAAI